MIETIDWNAYLPGAPLPNTGPKRLKVGEVWAVNIPKSKQRYVFRVGPQGAMGHGYMGKEILAGDDNVDFIAEDSLAAMHSVRVKSSMDTVPLPPADFWAAVYGKPQPFAFPIHPKRPAWIAVVEKIMTKAEEHKLANRTLFHQVFVSMDEYKVLKEHLRSEGDPWLNTAIGNVSVHPINPSGVTFSD